MRSLSQVVVCVVAVAGCLAVAGSVPALRADTLPPHKTSARVAIDPKVQAKATRMVVVRTDLPSGWFAAQGLSPRLDEHQGPGLKCGGHTADLSSLVQRGGWGSKFGFNKGRRVWVLQSDVSVLATAQQARLLFRDSLRWLTKYCFARGQRSGRFVYTAAGRVSIAKMADEIADIRTLEVATSKPKETVGSDYIFFREGAVLTVVNCAWETTPFPSSLRDRIIRILVARARSSQP